MYSLFAPVAPAEAQASVPSLLYEAVRLGQRSFIGLDKQAMAEAAANNGHGHGSSSSSNAAGGGSQPGGSRTGSKTQHGGHNQPPSKTRSAATNSTLGEFVEDDLITSVYVFDAPNSEDYRNSSKTDPVTKLRSYLTGKQEPLMQSDVGVSSASSGEETDGTNASSHSNVSQAYKALAHEERDAISQVL